MTLAELIQEVFIITKRPDLVALTTSAIKASTLKCHTSDFFFKDLEEELVLFPSSDYIQELDAALTFPLYRNAKYFRTMDTTTNTPGAFFTPIAPQNTLDSYGVNKVNIFYQAGATVNFKGAAQFSAGILGFYSYPNTTDAGFSSWIAREQPWAIIYDAAAKIMKSNGYDQQAQGVRALAIEALQEVIAAGIVEIGE